MWFDARRPAFPSPASKPGHTTSMRCHDSLAPPPQLHFCFFLRLPQYPISALPASATLVPREAWQHRHCGPVPRRCWRDSAGSTWSRHATTRNAHGARQAPLHSIWQHRRTVLNQNNCWRRSPSRPAWTRRQDPIWRASLRRVPAGRAAPLRAARAR